MTSQDKMNPLVDHSSTDSPSTLKELLRERVVEELATPPQTSTGVLLTPNLNACLTTLGLRVTLIVH